jgi:hypothetical protein
MSRKKFRAVLGIFEFKAVFGRDGFVWRSAQPTATLFRIPFVLRKLRLDGRQRCVVQSVHPGQQEDTFSGVQRTHGHGMAEAARLSVAGIASE